MGMRGNGQEATGSAGVHRVVADFEELGWGPVENNQHDLGIDLFLQVRDERRFDRTVLMAAQVKAGPSFFSSPQYDETEAVEGWWYSESDARRFEDWVQHGLPHLMVLHDPATRISYWAHVTRDSVKSAGEGFKVLVPSAQRVERAQLPALLGVAATVKTARTLEGTTWTAGAGSVAPGRAVRHALVAPRLIVPNPNTEDGRALEPEEAIALVSLGRTGDLQRYIAANPSLQRLEQQAGWRWRFLHAYRRAVEHSDIIALQELAAADDSRHSKHMYRRAAVAVACAVFLANDERWDEAENALEAAGEDLSPVDHAWVLLHKALLAGERGDIARARLLAAEGLRTVGLDADDVTARAFAAAAAAFLFESSRWDARDLEQMLTTGDTATAWWRSQSIAQTFTERDSNAFAAWGGFREAGASLTDSAEARLQGVWLQASFSGARHSAATIVAQRASQSVIRHEALWRNGPASGADAQIVRLADALGELRRYGRSKELSLAAERLWAGGPAHSLIPALTQSLKVPWRHTPARTTLLLWERAGDLMATDEADAAARECFRILHDPHAFQEQVHPNFVSDHFTLKALSRLLSAASDATHVETLSHVAEFLGRDSPRTEDLTSLVAQLRPAVLESDAEFWRQAAHSQDHPGLSAAMLGLLAQAGDAEAQGTLIERAQEGDTEAFEVLSYEQRKDAAGSKLVGVAVAHCRAQLAAAAQGSWGENVTDYGEMLVQCNLAAPADADWVTVLDLIAHPRVAVGHKWGALRLLVQKADELPEVVAAQLRGSVAVQPDRLHGVNAWTSTEAMQEPTLALGHALGVVETDTVMTHAAQLLRGGPGQRLSATRLLRHAASCPDEPLSQGMLLALASDVHPMVRGEAAAVLMSTLVVKPSRICQEAVVSAAGHSGCFVPLIVARSIPGARLDSDLRQRLVRLLEQHRSAVVRNEAARKRFSDTHRSG
ncbi:DUF4365 domain-containing protein [Streptomyces sp. NPDC085479]|uniref:DUF4365 domain-containing protein n=1 Tax=Streptomyces sp. NPDC085479 TaxID=3365726 RepID=UPI0037D0F79B